ncbi:MAG: hypothetical protein AAB131_05935 [Actinomycetota bacterium]
MNRLPCTVTWNNAEPELPEASLATQVTVVEPIGNRLPDGGVQTNDTTPTVSAADAL